MMIRRILIWVICLIHALLVLLLSATLGGTHETPNRSRRIPTDTDDVPPDSAGPESIGASLGGK